MGLLAGENDIHLLEETKVGRNINRHYYSVQEAEENMERLVVKQLFRLMRFRNSYPVFDGQFSVEAIGAHGLRLTWQNEPYQAALECDLKRRHFQITYLDQQTNQKRTLSL